MDHPRLLVAFVGILTLMAFGAVLKLTAGFVIPLVVALLLAVVLSPLVDRLSSYRVPRILGIILVILLLLCVFYLIGLFLFSSAQSFVRQFPRYQQRMVSLLIDMQNRLNARSGLIGDYLATIQWGRTISGYVVSWSGAFMSFMTSVGIIMVFLFFILLEKPYLHPKMQEALQGNVTIRIVRILEHIITQTGRYLTIKLVISIITGVLVGVTYSLIGVDFAVLWAALAFFFNFIPNIGSLVLGLVTVLFSVVQFYPSLDKPILVAVDMLIIQQVMGSFIEPKLQGDSLNLSPVIILFSLLFWGWLWGIVGMFLSVPLMVTIKIICENISYLRPVSVLMGTGQRRDVPSA